MHSEPYQRRYPEESIMQCTAFCWARTNTARGIHAFCFFEFSRVTAHRHRVFGSAGSCAGYLADSNIYLEEMRGFALSCRSTPPKRFRCVLEASMPSIEKAEPFAVFHLFGQMFVRNWSGSEQIKTLVAIRSRMCIYVRAEKYTRLNSYEWKCFVTTVGATNNELVSVLGWRATVSFEWRLPTERRLPARSPRHRPRVTHKDTIELGSIWKEDWEKRERLNTSNIQ